MTRFHGGFVTLVCLAVLLFASTATAQEQARPMLLQPAETSGDAPATQPDTAQPVVNDVAKPQPTALDVPAPEEPVAEHPRVIVQDLRADGVSQGMADSLTDLLVVEMVRQDRYEVLSRKDVLAILQNEEQKELLGCDEDQCISDFGKLMDSPYLLKGSVGKLGETFVVNLDLINTRSLKVERRVSQTLAGKGDDLIAVIRAAVLALELGERGAGKKITEDMLEDMLISQKLKTMFFHVRAGIEVPIGDKDSDDTITYVMPSTMMNILVDASYNIFQWFSIGLSTGFAFSLDNKYTNQYKQGADLYDGAISDENIVGRSILVNVSEFDYFMYRIPVDLIFRFQPEEGSFLPYLFFGPGISYNAVSFDDESLDRREDYFIDGVFPALSDSMLGDPQTDADGWTYYSRKMKLQPEEGTISYMAMDVVAGAGLDLLLSQHVGLSFEVRYLFSYGFSEEEQVFSNTSDPLSYRPRRFDTSSGTAVVVQDGQPVTAEIKDIAPVRQINHSLAANIGVLFYF